MAFTVRLFLLSSLLLLPTYVLAQTNGSIAVGASLSTAGNSSWLSPSGDFAFGFRQLENNDLFLLSIWFAKIPDKTIVWYANGDKPAPNGSVVNLTANSGLVLTSPQGEQLWKSNQTIPGVVAHGVMIDTGNFVLENEKSAKLWETFKNPTDTMLPGQILERGGKLSSRNSETDYTRGHFQLDFQYDGNLVLSGQKSHYSTRTTTGSVPDSEGKQLVFNESGDFYILRKNGGYYNFTAEERAARDYYLWTTLRFDGVLAQYFLPKTSVGNISWVPLWSIVKKKKNGSTSVHVGSVLRGTLVFVSFMLGTAVCLGLFFSFRKKHARFPQNDLDTNLREEATNSMASSSSPSARRWEHDVFLSFRGPDTRKGITSDIYDRLDTSRIKTFMDDRGLQVGDVISEALVSAIKESRFAIVVLSQNYASSVWCLEELREICLSMEDNRILPLFYHVNPNDVRYQKESFEDAFSKHETSERHESEKVKQWKAALNKVANISGWNTNNYKTHKELVDVIAESLGKKLISSEKQRREKTQD